MKKKSLIIILSVVLAALIALFGVLYLVDKNTKGDNTKPTPSQSSQEKESVGNNITIKLVLADKSEQVFEIKTSASTLADALLEEKLISKEEYDAGFYTTINGVRADYTLDKLWWCINVNGEMASTGANEIKLNEGDKIDIIQTPA